MYIITKKELIKTVAERWKKAYFINSKWEYGADKKEIYNNLIEKKPKTELEVANIIGNNSWTDNVCNECGKQKEKIIVIGEPEDYESKTAYVCEECLNEALKLLNE